MDTSQTTAVILAAGKFREDGAFQDLMPPAMLQLADRPFLQHVVELLIDQEIHDIHFVLNAHPEVVEQHFGDGGRWGCRFHYHLAETPAAEWTLLRRLPLAPAETVVLADAEVLPKFDFAAIQNALPAVILNGTEWTGWAILRAAQFGRVASLPDRKEAAAWLLRAATRDGRIVTAETTLNAQTADGLLRAQDRMLRGAFPAIELSGRLLRDGIRVGHQSHIHPRAELIPPVFIGAESIVGARTHVGPNVVVGRECIVEPETTVRDALICDGSFVGEHLVLDRVLVNQSRLRNVRLGLEITVPDDLVLDSVHRHWFRRAVRNAASRLVALLLFLLTLPLTLGVLLSLVFKGQRPLIHRRKVMRLPVSDRNVFRETEFLLSFTGRDPESLSFVDNFLYVFLPGLPQVVLGRLNLVGVPPRDEHQAGALPEHWREAYLHSSAGLISEDFVHFTHPADASEQEASEIYYSRRGGIAEDFRLLGAYLSRVALECTGTRSMRPVL